MKLISLSTILFLFSSATTVAMFKETDPQIKGMLAKEVYTHYLQDTQLISEDEKKELKEVDATDSHKVAQWVRKSMPWDIPHRLYNLGRICTKWETRNDYPQYAVACSNDLFWRAIPITSNEQKTAGIFASHVTGQSFLGIGSNDYFLNGPHNAIPSDQNRVAFSKDSTQAFGLYSEPGLRTVLAVYDLPKKHTYNDDTRWMKVEPSYTIQLSNKNRYNRKCLTSSDDNTTIGILCIGDSYSKTVFKIFENNSSGKLLYTKTFTKGAYGDSCNIIYKDNTYSASFGDPLTKDEFVTFTYSPKTKQETQNITKTPSVPLVDGCTYDPTWVIHNARVTKLNKDGSFKLEYKTAQHKKSKPVTIHCSKHYDTRVHATLASPHVWVSQTKRKTLPGLNIHYLTSGTDGYVLASALQRLFVNTKNIDGLQKLTSNYNLSSLRNDIKENTYQLLAEKCLNTTTISFDNIPFLKQLIDTMKGNKHIDYGNDEEICKIISAQIHEQLTTYLQKNCS